MEEEKTVWDNLVDAFLEDLKEHRLDQSLYAFAIAYNIAMKEMEVEESNKEYCDYVDYVNAKTDLIWEEIGNIKEEYNAPNETINRLWMEFSILKQRVTDLASRPQVQPPSKMYPNNPNWNQPVVDPNYWQPHLTPHYVPPWKVTCDAGGGTITTNNDQPYQYDFSDLHKMTEGKYYTGWQPEPKQKGLYD